MKIIVNQYKNKTKKANIFLGVILLLIIAIIASNPKKYSLVAMNGIEIWAKILLPSLLPFFIFTKLFSSTGVVDYVTNIFSPITQKLFNCPKESSYVFFMSILSGYPVGSKLISDLYFYGVITKKDATKMTSFCSNSGPMFILGSVAIGMFSSKKMGYILLISHILGAIINGVVYRKYGKTKDNCKVIENNLQIKQQNSSEKIDFSKSVSSSVNSILLIGGVICFTFVLLEVITTSNIFKYIVNLFALIGLKEAYISAIFCGFGEITKGCLLLSQISMPYILSTALCSFIISFGGISTMLQSSAFLKGIVPMKLFFLQKITHAIFSCVISIILCFII